MKPIVNHTLGAGESKLAILALTPLVYFAIRLSQPLAPLRMEKPIEYKTRQENATQRNAMQ